MLADPRGPAREPLGSRQDLGRGGAARLPRTLPPGEARALSAADPFLRLLVALHERGVRFVLIGVAGANYYARSAASLFTTQDRDLFLPPDATNTLAAWGACRALGLALESGGELLGEPLDRELAERVVQRRASVCATDGRGLVVDLSYVMTGFDFESVERERRTFRVSGVEVPVASLGHIVRSKQATGREKDRLFLASHADAIRDLLRDDEGRE